ncbi:pilus assembly protein N-terminal domain-containing protein [Thiomicrospira microaerophila]|uniref:type II and III secretion system protein family protein n=1 Tax=Thiomicrospira microaerophila TaxID=406020 RepID=UPI00200FE1C2|nr:pilus assembly protein N-terminal domain-containing protein [Thiomicrospira microaerophila]UQB43066.1 pilus assembly protein N-terminal domain-containing protein [Thiomicrospira microaerophila]
MKRLISLAILLLSFSVVWAQSDIEIHETDTHVVRVSADLHRVMVVNSEVASVQVLNERELLINALKPGRTELLIWYRQSPTLVTRRALIVNPDSAQLHEIQALVAQLLSQIDVEGRVKFELKPVWLSPETAIRREVDAVGNARDEGSRPTQQQSQRHDTSILQDIGSTTVSHVRSTAGNYLLLLSGEVANEARKRRIQSVMSALGLSVINMINVDGPNQIKLSVRVAEVVKGNGLNHNPTLNYTRDVGSRDTSVNFLLEAANIASGVISGGTTNTLNNFQIGVSANRGNLLGTLSILESHNLARVLAMPELLVQAGETANFLVGGEVPLQIVDGQGNPSISYKEFGVSLKFSPIITEDGRIQMTVEPEVSNQVLTESNLPSFRTRRVKTTVTLGEGQSFVIGGLLQDNISSIVSRVPILGEIPILGVLFRSNNFIKEQTELVVIVTPVFEEPIQANQGLTLPGETLDVPDRANMFFFGQTHKLVPEGVNLSPLANLRTGLESPE